MEAKISLQEIAQWQLNPNQSKVELPTIQRGFVWKAKQVENLWDSLLRGYPIGSFLISQTCAGNYHLMDGQQRATSILLGFYNPYIENNTVKPWAIKGQLPVLWIDINPKEKIDTNQYSLRLTTRSHPWGYQAKNQDIKLSVPDRRNALELFQKDSKNTGNYTSFSNTTVFPYDAYYPLPLCFFMEAENSEQVVKMAKSHLPDAIKTKWGSFENKSNYLELLQSPELCHKIDELLCVIKDVKSRIINCDIISEKTLNEEQQADNPTLFIRINSAGTPLSGDDLIYAIYKATFPDTKQLVENIGMNFIPAVQIISLVSRMAWAESNNYPAKMNVRQFQQRIKDVRFSTTMQELITSGKANRLFKQAIDILGCKDNSHFQEQVPPVIIKHLVNRSSDLFLFLIYWLYIHDQTIIDDRLKLKIAAKLLTFGWFGFDNIPRLWREEIQNKDFWEKPITTHIWWDGNYGIHFLLPPKLLRDYYLQSSVEDLFIKGDKDRWGLLEDGVGKRIIDYYKSIKSDHFESQTANEYFWRFIQVIQQCRQLILFAQRTYINTSFPDYNQLEDMEDTNTPWDWDHIYPSEWVYRKVYCNQAIKDWNSTNGNFRAISLEQNRHEGNRIDLNARLSDVDIRRYSFIGDDWKYWSEIGDRIYGDNVQMHFRAITQRMINIYEKFWTDLQIENLIIDSKI